MKTTPITNHSLHFIYLPPYAQYLLDYRLNDFIEMQYKIAQRLNVPLLQAFAHMPKEEFETVLLNYGTEFLNYLATNKAEDYIQISIHRWTSNTFPNIDKHQIITEDLSLITFTRKKTFLQLLPSFCQDPEQLVCIIEELEYFFTKLNAATTETYINLLQEKIAEHLHFIEKVNTASPSAIYVFDIMEQRMVYTNHKFYELFGYTLNDLTSLQSDLFKELVHPTDLSATLSYFETFQDLPDKVIRSHKYRIKDKHNNFYWVRNYDTVFKRKEDETVWQVIGVIIDVNKEKTVADALRKRESQLTEAQALAHIGSWSWKLDTGEVTWSDEMYRIYHLDKAETILNLEFILSLTHPDDIAYVRKKIKEALDSIGKTEFQYRITPLKEQIKFIQATAEVIADEEGKAQEILGTVQDVTVQHHLIEELQKSEKLYKQAQFLAHIGNWSFNLETKEVVWSEEMYRIYGLPVNEPLSVESWIERIHPDDLEEVTNYWNECVNHKQPYDKTHRIVLKNGGIKMLHRKGEIEYNSEGKPIKVIGTTQDITVQDAIQQEVKEKQAFIQKITDATPSIITTYNVTEDRYVFVNEGLYNLLGYSTKEALNQGSSFFTNIVHPEDVDELVQKSYDALTEANNNPKENKVTEFTYRMLHKAGYYRWFTSYATTFDRNESGHVEHILRISLDVTEHVNARKKIEEQEFFIKQIADASPTILYLYDVDENRFTYINQEAFYVLGYTPEDIIDMREDVTNLLYHPEDVHLLPERKGSDKKFQHMNSMMQYECRLKSKAGEWCWLVVREVIFQHADGRASQLLGAALDITKRKEMEKSLVQNAFQLQQSNDSLEEFAYVASHDLKEPLRKISTFGDRIIHTQRDRLTEDGKVYLNKIIDSSQRMQTMINDLLSISMITGDRSFQPYSLQTLMEEVMQTLEYKIEKQNAVIEIQQLPEANVVASQFRQLFQNLLSNSLKFTRESIQPHICIDWKYLNAEDIDDMQVAKSKHYLQIRFADNGIGFEEEFAGKIFQIFQRLHGRSEYEGTGIGLAICKKIIEHHGGSISAQGSHNQGAIFTIILPASENNVVSQ